jgi:hypothetical protein
MQIAKSSVDLYALVQSLFLAMQGEGRLQNMDDLVGLC